MNIDKHKIEDHELQNQRSQKDLVSMDYSWQKYSEVFWNTENMSSIISICEHVILFQNFLWDHESPKIYCEPSSQVRTLFAPLRVYPIQCTSYTVYILYSVYPIQCITFTVYILYSVHPIVYILYSVYATQCILCWL